MFILVFLYILWDTDWCKHRPVCIRSCLLHPKQINAAFFDPKTIIKKLMKSITEKKRNKNIQQKTNKKPSSVDMPWGTVLVWCCFWGVPKTEIGLKKRRTSPFFLLHFSFIHLFRIHSWLWTKKKIIKTADCAVWTWPKGLFIIYGSELYIFENSFIMAPFSTELGCSRGKWGL